MLARTLIDLLRPFQFRGKQRLMARLAPRRGVVTADVFGARVELDLGEFIQRAAFLGTYEPEETAIIRRRLRPGMTFVDVGANVGYFSLLGASRVGPTGRVLAFEPSPYAFARLEAAVRANGLKQVHAVRLGLSDEAGERGLYVPGEGSDMHSPTMVAHTTAPATAVGVTTLDAFLDEQGVERVDLMKIDIEGHEYRALQGARRSLESGRIRAVLCEFNDIWLRESGSSPEELYSLLELAGYVAVEGRLAFPSGSVVTHLLEYRR